MSVQHTIGPALSYTVRHSNTFRTNKKKLTLSQRNGGTSCIIYKMFIKVSKSWANLRVRETWEWHSKLVSNALPVIKRIYDFVQLNVVRTTLKERMRTTYSTSHIRQVKGFLRGEGAKLWPFYWPALYYYCHKKKIFRWRNVKKTARTLYNAKTVTKRECDAKCEQSVSQICGHSQSCRDQESFGQTVPSSTDAWRTPAKTTMWEMSEGCSMSAPQPLGKRGRRWKGV